MKRPHPPTERQREIMRLVAELTEQHGRPPSATELGEALGISRQGAGKALAALEARGWLSDVPLAVHSGKWRVTEEGARWLGS